MQSKHIGAPLKLQSKHLRFHLERVHEKAHREEDGQRGKANGAEQSNDVIEAVSKEQRQNLHKGMVCLMRPPHRQWVLQITCMMLGLSGQARSAT